MNVLLTNDDGIHSKSLLALAGALSTLPEISGLTVVAPQHEQSGVGHAFSFYSTIRYGKAAEYPCEAYWLKGTPSDCTKFAICEILKGRTPDLVLSGINNGENAGVAVVYSGTVAGAREGALWGVPSIALSVQESQAHVIQRCIDWVVQIVRNSLHRQIAQGTYWSANFPAVPAEDYRGMRVCPMSPVMFIDEYLKVTNPRHQEEYWLTGFKNRPEFPEGSDDWWMAQGYSTLTPLLVDQSAHNELSRLQTLSGLLD